MKINKEGYTIIVTSFIIISIIAIVSALLLPAWVGWLVGIIGISLLGFILVFFREPKRPFLNDDNIVYAPADGKVVVIEEVNETEYLNEKRVQISVFMSLTNVHINWYPIGGQVEYFRHHPGDFMVAWHPKSSELNERTTTVVNNGRHRILFRQIAGYVARRIVSYAKVGDVVGQNSKCGFIKFGSRVDILLPPGSEILVSMDDKVVGSQTPIARLK